VDVGGASGWVVVVGVEGAEVDGAVLEVAGAQEVAGCGVGDDRVSLREGDQYRPRRYTGEWCEV
jgi:hypothetical protein